MLVGCLYPCSSIRDAYFYFVKGSQVKDEISKFR